MANSGTPLLQNDAEAAINATQAAFAMNPVLGPQSRHFWQAQNRFLEEAQKFSSAWFERRLQATRTALDTASQIAETKGSDPAAAMKVLADWQSHSVERLTEDAREFAEMMTRCASSLVSNEVEAIEETMEETTRSTKTAHSTPV